MLTTNEIELKSLDYLCCKHDWNYRDTDDHYVYKKYDALQKDIDNLINALVESGLGKEVQYILSKYNQGECNAN